MWLRRLLTDPTDSVLGPTLSSTITQSEGRQYLSAISGIRIARRRQSGRKDRATVRHAKLPSVLKHTLGIKATKLLCTQKDVIVSKMYLWMLSRKQDRCLTNKSLHHLHDRVMLLLKNNYL